jgi:hypothetical protein
MIAIVIHFMGFYVVNAMIPAWACEVDGELASIWYLSFACIDAMALSITQQPAIKLTLAASCAWSATLAIETWFLQDQLQSADFVAQYLIDGVLIALFLIQAWIIAKDTGRFGFGRF